MKRNTIILLLFCALTVLTVLGFSEGNAYAKEKASKEKVSCITSKCHATMKKAKYVHGPVQENECTVCHGESSKNAAKPKK